MKTKKIVALLLVCVMAFSFTACKKNSAGTNNVASTVPGTLYAGFEWAVVNETEKANYIKDEARFIDIATTDIGLTEEKAKSLLANVGTWSIYTIDVQINNNSATSKTFVGFAATGLPAGMWLNTAGSYELTVPANVTDEYYPVGIIVDNTLLNKVEVYNALSKMKLELVYFETPADGSDEVPESEYKKFPVSNNLVAPAPDSTQNDSLLSAKRVNVEDGSSILESYKGNSAAFNSESKLFGLDSATASKVLADGSTWQWYVLNIEIENKTTSDLNIYGIIAENNGKNGVWVCSVSQYGEFGMPAKDKQILPVNVLVDTSAIGDKSVQEAISEVKIQLEYFTGEYDEDMVDEDSVVKSFITVK